MNAKEADLIADVSAYYTSTIVRHGATPKGVDWNSSDGQNLRFRQLSRLITCTPFSVNDLGCGYGALFSYLDDNFSEFAYHGYDVSEAMIGEAGLRLPKDKVHLCLGFKPDRVADYGIASGVFNVRLGRRVDEWESYIESTLDMMNETSNRGFSFNCLTKYSDPEKMQTHLYYADPLRLFDLCKRRYSPQVALLHDYGLWEFTILVRKDK